MDQMEQDETVVKPSKKPLIILVLAIIVSLTAGAGGMFFYMNKQIEHKIEEACAEPEHPVNATIYNELEKPLIVNFPQGSSIHLIKMTLAFSAEDAATIAVLKKNEPMLLNNLLMLISAHSPEGLKTHDGKVALQNAIFDDVTSMLEKMSPESEIKEVFFTSFIMQ